MHFQVNRRMHDIGIPVDMYTLDIAFYDSFLALNFLIIGQFVQFRIDEEK